MVITPPMASLWIFAAILCAGMMSVASGEEPNLGARQVSVVVSNFRNAHGFLGCRLYRFAEGFPESGTDLSESRVRVAGAATRCEFRSVAPGTYAVAVMHDENDNRKLDKNFLGIPIEGYGVSNNKTYAMSTPKWSESTFQVGAQDVVLSIVLRY